MQKLARFTEQLYHRLFIKILISMSLVSVVGLLTIATSMTVGRIYGASGLGFFGTITSIAQILGTLCGSSIGIFALTNLPSLLREKSIHAKDLGLALFARVIILCLPIALLLAFIVDFDINRTFTGLVVVAIVATSLQNYGRDLLRCHQAIVSSYVVLMTVNFSVLVLIYLNRVPIISGFTLYDTLFISYSFGIVVCVCIISNGYITNPVKKIVNLLSEGIATDQPNKQKTRDSISLYWPMIVASAAQVLLARTDILIANTFGTTALAGELTAAVTVSSISIMGLAALNAIYVPKLNASRLEEYPKLLLESQRIGAVIVIFACLIIFYYGKFIISLFGFESAHAVYCLQILMIGAVVNALTGPVIYLGLKISGGVPVARILLVAVACNLIGDLLVFNYFGIVGLAFVTTVVSSATNILVLRLVRREYS